MQGAADINTLLKHSTVIRITENVTPCKSNLFLDASLWH